VCLARCRRWLSIKGFDRPTRLLQFVTFVHLPYSLRSLDLFVVFMTAIHVVRRIFK